MCWQITECRSNFILTTSRNFYQRMDACLRCAMVGCRCVCMCVYVYLTTRSIRDSHTQHKVPIRDILRNTHLEPDACVYMWSQGRKRVTHQRHLPGNKHLDSLLTMCSLDNHLTRGGIANVVVSAQLNLVVWVAKESLNLVRACTRVRNLPCCLVSYQLPILSLLLHLWGKEDCR